MTGSEQPAQISLLTEIGGSVKFLVCIANPFRTNTDNWMEPLIQPTIFHSNEETVLGKLISTISPSGFWIMVLMFPYPGGILITALG